MLIIPVKKGESIERVLKRYKRKVQKTQVLTNLKKRKEYEKPSTKRRQQIIKAKHVQRLKDKQSDV